ncbi:unnamed protein product [Symbiodinium sp. CCMP2592]|nr:unnamed protein product [Symbiodinium sp. CCMP2592]
MDRSRAHFAMDASGMPGLLQSSTLHRPPNEVPLRISKLRRHRRCFGFGALAQKPLAQASKRSSGNVWALWAGARYRSSLKSNLSIGYARSLGYTADAARSLEAKPSRSLTICSLGLVRETWARTSGELGRGTGIWAMLRPTFRVCGLGFRDLARCEPSWTSSGEVAEVTTTACFETATELAKLTDQATPCDRMFRDQPHRTSSRPGLVLATRTADGIRFTFTNIQQEHTSFKALLRLRCFRPLGPGWISRSCVSMASLSGPGLLIRPLEEPQASRQCGHLNSLERLWHAPLLISERITRERFMPPLHNSLNCGRSGKPPSFSGAFAWQNVDGEIDQTAGSRTLENQHRVKAIKDIAEPGLGTAVSI